MDRLSQEVSIIIIGSFFFLFIAVGIIILILVYQKKQLRHILEKRDLQNQFHQELMKTRLEARDEAVDNLSKELHDNVGQLLSSALVLINVAKRSSQPEESLHMASESIQSAIQELRSLSKSLNSSWLEKFNLFENLQTEAARLNASHELTITIPKQEEIMLSPDRQLMLYRIVQEAVQNALKHGKAENISITVEQMDHHLMLVIEDDGQGFDTENLPSSGLGITNMRNRAKVMGGTVHWKFNGKGTSVLIELPSIAS